MRRTAAAAVLLVLATVAGAQPGGRVPLPVVSSSTRASRDTTPLDDGRAPSVIIHEIALFHAGSTGDLPVPPPFVARRTTRVLDLAPPDALALRPLPEARPEDTAPLERKADPDERNRTAMQAFVFVAGSGDSRLELTARYPGGQPMAWSPAAQIVAEDQLADAQPLLAWTGTVTSRPRVPRVDRDHFWSTLRRRQPAGFSSSGGGAERFIYHQGMTMLEPAFAVERRPPSPSALLIRASGLERMLWLSVDGRVRRVRLPAEATEFEVDLGDGTNMDLVQFRRELERALEGAGLTVVEARNAVEVWQGLLLSREPRAISLVPRGLMDWTVPLTASPAPAEMVRVALLVQDL